ncbi:MAG TPA: tetratricopeptide repeat protein [Vicinamibacteria bacterium]|nr:tetratricopeptide repeat protein [Vicinamibacteria bacterium]
MNHLIWLLAAALAVPAAADKEKDKKKAAEAPPKAISAADLVRQAEEKVAAGDHAGAAELLRKAAALPDAGSDVSMRLGRVLEAAYELDGAIDAYTSAGAALTGAAKGEALGRLALVQEARGVGDFGQTAAAAVAADAEGAMPAMALSRARAREGKGDEALALAQKAVGAHPGPDAQATLGRAHEVRNELAEAEAAYRAAGADGSHLAASVGLARVLRRTGRAAEALPLLEKVIAAAPGAVQAYKESARAKIAVGRGAEALGDAATAAALAENDPEAAQIAEEAAVAKAVSYIAQNQPDLAIQDLTALRDKSPDLAIARVGLGRAYAARREADPALVELNKAIELDPSSAEAHATIGEVQQMLKKNPAAAVTAYEKAMAAAPDHAGYRTKLAGALLALGAAQIEAKKYKESIATLTRASTLAPDDAQIEASLAWGYFGVKDAASFKAHGAKARSLGYKEPTLLQYLARIEAGEPIK